MKKIAQIFLILLISVKCYSQSKDLIVRKVINYKSDELNLFKAANLGENIYEFAAIEIGLDKIGAEYWFFFNWQGDSDIDFYYRIAQESGIWGDWTPINLDVEGFENSTDTILYHFSNTDFFSIDANYFQLKGVCKNKNGADNNQITQLNLNLNVFPNNDRPKPAANGKSVYNNKLAGGCSCPLPSYVDRDGWNCPDGESPSCGTPSYTTVSFLIVHHEAGSNIEPAGGWDDRVLAIWDFHTTPVADGGKGYCDIGYNWLVDRDGVLYEGRGGGDNVVGAHFSCANTYTMGVCVLGDCDILAPTASSINMVEDILAWKACQEGIDPLGSAYHSPSQLTINNISGHRDVNTSPAPGACPSGTVCPGDYLYSDLTEIRNAVNDCVTGGGAGGVDVAVTDVSPESDAFTCGDVVLVEVTAENFGDVSLTTPSLSYYFSPDCTIGDGDEIGLGTDEFPTLDPGEFSTESEYLTIPSGYPNGTYYILALVDYTGEFSEINEANNVLCASFTYTCDPGTPDIVMWNPSLSTTIVTCGDNITATSYAKNQGTADLDDAEIGYYFSTDIYWDEATDYYFSEDDLAAITAGATSPAETQTLTIPSGYPNGTYYILFVADHNNIVDEGVYENNNVSFIPITYTCDIDYIDIGVIDLISPSSGCALTGSESITVTIQNFGTTTITSIPIKYKVDAGSTISETAPLTLTPGSIGNYTFSTTYDFTTPGSYSIDSWTSLLTDENAINDHHIESITSFETPDVELGPPIVTCDETTLDAGNPGANYIWSTGATTQTIDVITSGTYSVTVTNPVGGCFDTDNILVTINYSPIANYSSSISDLTVSFTNTSLYGTSYFWQFGDGFTSTATNPVHTYATYGDYTVLLTVSNACGSDIISHVISLDGGTPLPDITDSIISVTPTVLHAGDLITITYIMSNIGSADVVGDFKNRIKFSSDCDLLTATLIRADNYTDVPGAGDAMTITITDTIPLGTAEGIYGIIALVDAVEEITEISDDNNSYCYESIQIISATTTSADLIATINDIETPIYSGDAIDVNMTAQNIGTATSDICDLAFYITDDCFGDIHTFLSSESIDPLAPGSSATFTVSVPIPDGLTVGSHYFMSNIDFSNFVTESNELNNSDCQLINVSDPTGVESNKPEEIIYIYPNPSDDILYIHLLNSFGGKLEVYDLAGQSVNITLINSISTEMDVSTLASGVYFIKYTEGGAEQCLKFIKD